MFVREISISWARVSHTLSAAGHGLCSRLFVRGNYRSGSKSVVFENHPILARQAPATTWDAKLCDQALSHEDRYAAGARSGLRVGVESDTTGGVPEQFLGDCDVRAAARSSVSQVWRNVFRPIFLTMPNASCHLANSIPHQRLVPIRLSSSAIRTRDNPIARGLMRARGPWCSGRSWTMHTRRTRRPQSIRIRAGKPPKVNGVLDLLHNPGCRLPRRSCKLAFRKKALGFAHSRPFSPISAARETTPGFSYQRWS
jgi:hypothetical protein